MIEQENKLEYRIDTTSLLHKFSELQGGGHLATPLTILNNLLGQVAERAIKINDKELNKLMLRLGLYSISNPRDDDFDLNKTLEILEQ